MQNLDSCQFLTLNHPVQSAAGKKIITSILWFTLKLLSLTTFGTECGSNHQPSIQQREENCYYKPHLRKVPTSKRLLLKLWGFKQTACKACSYHMVGDINFVNFFQPWMAHLVWMAASVPAANANSSTSKGRRRSNVFIAWGSFSAVLR